SNSIAMYLSSSNHITVENCDIHYSGIDGIQAWGEYINIQNNNIAYANNMGINLTGSSANATVINNSLKSIGVIPGMTQTLTAGSISVRGNNSLVQYNSVDSSGTGGILFSGFNTQIR